LRGAERKRRIRQERLSVEARRLVRAVKHGIEDGTNYPTLENLREEGAVTGGEKNHWERKDLEGSHSGVR